MQFVTKIYSNNSTDIVCTNLSYLYKYLCIHGKWITCSFALWWILISEILKQINILQWLQSLFIFISRTRQKVCLVLIKRCVNTVAYLYQYYTCNWINIEEELHSYLCYTHCNQDYFTMKSYWITVIMNVIVLTIIIMVFSSNHNRLPWSCNRPNHDMDMLKTKK